MQNLLDTTFGLCLINEHVRQEGVANLYRGIFLPTDQRILIKVFHLFTHVGNEYNAIPAFDAYIQRVAALDHPNVIPIVESGSANNMPYIATGYVKSNLVEFLEDAPYSLNEALGIFEQIIAGVSYVHRAGISHCNIRPADIYHRPDGRIALADIGLSPTASRIVDETGLLTLSKVAQSGTTSEYIAPEQASGRTPDVRSDIYALGIVLYELLTGRVPFKGKNPVKTMLMHLEEPVKSPRMYNPGIPTYVEKVIYQALAKEADYRFDSAAHMANALGLQAV